MPSIVKPTRVSVAYQSDPVSGGGLTTVSAYVMVDFADPTKVLTEQALWPMVTEQMPNGAIFDKGRLKPKGEVIIAGHALSPTDQPVEALRVIARFGTMQKRLAVFGDRYWRLTDRGIEMLPAQPFLKMPIGDMQAFGGPNHKFNPRGKGHGGRQIVESGYDAPLPNVEALDNPIRSIDDNPAPSHFGPLPPDSPMRLRYVGTYDQHWVKHVSPLRPDDFNPLFNCDAPDDQRFDSHIAGGETFSISGMSRGEATVGGQLPAFRARAFYHLPQKDDFSEIGMVCDTVTLFPNVQKATLAFRGLIKGESRFADDIGAIMFAIENQADSPRSQAYYLDVFQKRRDPKEAHKYALSDFQLMPDRNPAEVGARRQAKLDKALADRIRFAENSTWGVKKFLEGEGMSSDIVPPANLDSIHDFPLVPQPTPEELENGELDLAELLDDVRTLQDALTERMKSELINLEMERRKIVETLPAGMLPPHALKPVVGEDMLKLLPGLEFPDESVTDFPLPDGFSEGMDQVSAVLADTKTQISNGLGGEDNPFADDLTEATNSIFDMLEGGLPLSREDADRSLEQAKARALGLPEGSVLADARKSLNDLDLGPLDAITTRSADNDAFTDAFGGLLDNVPELPELGSSLKQTLNREQLLPANPEDSPEVRAQAENKLAEADEKIRTIAGHLIPEDAPDALSGIMDWAQNLQDSVAGDVDVSDPQALVADQLSTANSRLDQADVQMAEGFAVARKHSPAALFPLEALPAGVPEAFGAFVRDEVAQGRDFKGADLAGAVLIGLDLSHRDLSGTFFERADLSGANFAGSNLVGAVFCEATLDGANFTGCDLTEANFCKASMKGTCLDKTRITDASLINTDLTDVSAKGAELARLRIIECSLDGVSLAGGRLADIQLINVSANGLCLDNVKVERTVFMNMKIDNLHAANAEFERVGFLNMTAPGAVFTGSRFTSTAFAGETDLEGAWFDSIKAFETSWNGLNVTESCFLRANCRSSFFNQCNMEASDFRLASLKNCLFGGSSLVFCDFFGADLYGAALDSTDLRRANFRNANLYGASLLEAKLASADLSGANLGLTLMSQVTHA